MFPGFALRLMQHLHCTKCVKCSAVSPQGLVDEGQPGRVRLIFGCIRHQALAFGEIAGMTLSHLVDFVVKAISYFA